MLFTQTFYGLLFSYFTITDVTSYAHHKFPVSLLLYIATKKLKQTITVNSSTNAPTTKNNSCTLCVPMCFVIPLSRRVGYVMHGSMGESVRDVCLSHQSDWIYYKQPIKFLVVKVCGM